jgi:hypothetical protein
MKRILLHYSGDQDKLSVYKFVGNMYDLFMDSFKLSRYGEDFFTAVWVLREEDYKRKIVPLLIRNREFLEELVYKDILPRGLEDLRLLAIRVWYNSDIIANITFNLDRLKSDRLRSLTSIKEIDAETSRTISLGEEILNSIKKDKRSVAVFDVKFLNYEPMCTDILLAYVERYLEIPLAKNTFPELAFFKDKIVRFSLLTKFLSIDLLMKVSRITREMDVDKLKYIYSEEDLLKLLCKHFGERSE